MIKNDYMTTKKKAQRSPVPAKNVSTTSLPNTIAHILGQHEAYSLWLCSRKNSNPDVFIALVDDLPASDRNELAKITRLVIKARDDLVKRIAEIEREKEHLESLLLTDDLTNLYNKRFFSIQLEVEMDRTRRTGHPCTLMMMDLDNFKILNDTLGHDAGDRFIFQMGELIRKSLRPTDFACRFGGDEFAVIMPASSPIDSIRVANRIQISMGKLVATLPAEISEHLSASFGLATYEILSPISADDFFKQADTELYNAKKEGKNRISCGPFTGADSTAVSVKEKAALSQPLLKSR